MATKVQPIAVPLRDAAALLSMKQKDFLKLVSDGVLPRSLDIIPGHALWAVSSLIAVVEGTNIQEDEFQP